MSGEPLHFTLSSAAGPLDRELRLGLAGLGAEEKVLLKASVTDDRLVEWVSWAYFQADAEGRVDLASQAPLDGSYQGVEPMGLLRYMTPAQGLAAPDRFRHRHWDVPVATRLEAAAAPGGPATLAEIPRPLLEPGSRVKPVRRGRLVGTLFLPPGRGPWPGVLDLGGWEGGLAQEPFAALLCSHGLAVLAVAWWGLPGLPAAPAQVALEYFAEAVEFLRTHREVRGTDLAIVGTDRGAEAALMVGAAYGRFRAAAVWNPSAVLWSGPGDHAGQWGGPLLTYQGRPLPHLEADLTHYLPQHQQGPIITRCLFNRPLDDPARAEAAAIPVEKLGCPLLVCSGQEDQVWPSERFAALIRQRLVHHGLAATLTQRSYEGAGHLMGSLCLPNTPASVHQTPDPQTGLQRDLGGEAAASAAAATDSFLEATAFLQRNLLQK
ncbi:MAG: acyl-CoA thioesterase/BAAT N-terminal domain-containing protein [Deltaproteobacteria bacterium]|nr:acyl-CoA thioesterase/BAAT N-terminal domain-containing protein [Deltaproteobacteria bacterium]MCB2186338.1 acyl-CoA thioesterase/BAAT N-terminal domain-containing protein [Deltaproteobacteria bacterium]